MNESQGTFNLPPSASVQADQVVDPLFAFIFWMSVVFFAIVAVGSLYLAVRYRQRSATPKLTSGKDHNIALELVWTVIPTILVMIVFFWGFRAYLNLYLAPANAILVNVEAKQWQWRFLYPDGYDDLELHVPAGRPVKLLMHSIDVIHSLYIPDFRVKMDVLPNRYTSLWFEAKPPATDGEKLDLFCTEYCGLDHSRMLSKVVVHTEAGYQEWQKKKIEERDASQSLPLHKRGEQLFTARGCIACHAMDFVGPAPNLKGRFGKGEKLEGGGEAMVDENYIRESILDPQVRIVAGYKAIAMPTFKGQLDDQQLSALVAYVRWLTEGDPKPAP